MSALDDARRELDEIDWVHGIAPMPPHLVEQGTVRREYRQGVRLTGPIKVGFVSETTAAPTHLAAFEVYDLPEPYYEIRVWGELVERGPL